MPTLADSLVSSSARRLTMRKRPDLVVERHRYQGRISWVVKDPVGLKYFRFQEGEFAILNMLDGNVSLDEIKERFEAEFPPEKITVEELQQFIGSLHRSGLILANVPGQGEQLRMRRDERKWKEFLGAMTNILAIRFKGIDPNRLLNTLYPFVRWMFSRWAVACSLLLAASALLLILVQFDVFQSKLPAFHQFFNVKNAFLLAVALGVTKVIHEFGHGMTCKHFGGECHEIGVLVLVLTPCLYCNVSDSWMLPNKWQRAMIGAAGMYVEVIIASVCTWIWWFSEPGLLNYLCLSTMFVCSVSTVIFNGNPLLRYDGYYILSDIMEIPNLRQKSTDILNRKLGKWCLGIDPPDDPFLPERNQMMFALYTVAAAMYRWVVVFSILWFLYKVFEPYRLEVIGQLITAAAVYGLLFQPIYKVAKFFWVPGRVEKVKKPRMYATLGLITAVVLAIAYIPLPFRVLCTFEVQPEGESTVYVEIPGTLMASYVQPGDVVSTGQELAQLRNMDLDLSIEQLVGQRDQYREQYQAVLNERYANPQASLQLAQIEKSLEAIEKQLVQKNTDRDRLTLKAKVAGTVLPAPLKKGDPTDAGQLPEWSGYPTQAKNLGCFLSERAPFCLVGDPKRMEAMLVIDQADIEFVRPGSKVQLMLEQHPGEVLNGAITRISDVELEYSSQRLSNKAGGELATETDESGMERPQSTQYQASVPLENADGQYLRIGLRGKGKIEAGTRTIGQRVWRYVMQTFNFSL